MKVLRQHGLVGVEGREGLQLDQLWLEFSAGIAHQPEIHLDEHRVRRLVGEH